MTQLQKMQEALVKRATSIWLDMRFDFKDNYAEHFMTLGETIQQIDSYKSEGDLLKDLYNDEFGHLGLCDDEDYEEFIRKMYA